jgi:hypothetical protein
MLGRDEGRKGTASSTGAGGTVATGAGVTAAIDSFSVRARCTWARISSTDSSMVRARRRGGFSWGSLAFIEKVPSRLRLHGDPRQGETEALTKIVAADAPAFQRSSRF